MASRLQTPPPWWDELVEFIAARYHAGASVAILRETGRLLMADPALTPHQLLRSQATHVALSSTTERVLTAFFTSRGLALQDDIAHQRAAARREGYLTDIPSP